MQIVSLKSLLTASAVIALSSSAAIAGSLAPAAPEPAVVVPAPVASPPAANWGGAYAGANLSWGQADLNFSAIPSPSDIGGVVIPDNTLSEMDGFGGGLRVGYDWQSSNLVFGVGAEYSFGTISGGFKHPDVMDDLQQHHSLDARISNMATVFGRIGYDAGAWLPYALAGYTWADADGEYWSGTTQNLLRDESLKVEGATLGIGVERRLTQQWTAYGEWTHTDFGAVARLSNIPIDLETSVNQIKLGVNYRF